MNDASGRPDLYICPTTGETESRTLGGSACCDHPRCPGNLYAPRPESAQGGVADCKDCDEAAAGDALAWVVAHSKATGHTSTAWEPA